MSPPPWQIWQGGALTRLADIPDRAVQSVITSPPYFQLRDYGTGDWDGGDPECDHLAPLPGGHEQSGLGKYGNHLSDEMIKAKVLQRRQQYRVRCARCGAVRVDEQIGLEETPELYVEKLVEIFHEVKRVLRDDGTLWLNLGDSYASHGGQRAGGKGPGLGGTPQMWRGQPHGHRVRPAGYKRKDLLGVPWAVAQALRAPYYLGEMREERDRIWLAATLDAEGSISGFTHVRADDGSTRTGVQITITNTVERMLDEADRIWPASRVEHEHHGEGHRGSRPSWRCCSTAERKAMLMRELYPYLIAKREQARLAYAFLLLSVDAKRLGHSPQRDATREKRAWIVNALSRLNRGEDVDVPGWIGEPPSCTERGWYLRKEIIWEKPNCTPESVGDRPTKSHEHIFLLSKSRRYYYDAQAIREPDKGYDHPRTVLAQPEPSGGLHPPNRGIRTAEGRNGKGRNKRSVWTVPTVPFKGAHYATFPPKLIEPAVLAGAPPGGVILDPFAGTCVTIMVAVQHGRRALGIELNAHSIALGRARVNAWLSDPKRMVTAA